MTTKPIIIAIVGASGCGKTTLSLHLQKHYGIPAICSYTTRPMRDDEENGREHWFVDYSYVIPQNPLAYTFFGGHHYWTEVEQIQAPIVSYVIDEKGLLELKSKWDDTFQVFSCYIVRKDNPTEAVRQNRDKERIFLSDNEYDIIINNDGCLAEFLCNIETIINRIKESK